MNVAAYIAHRLRLNVSGQRRSPSVAIAVTGIAVAVVVMTLTVAIVTGFKEQIAGKVTGFESQITLTPVATDNNGESVVATLSPELKSLLEHSLPAGCDVSVSLRRPSVLKTDSAFVAMAFVAYGAGHDYSFVRDNLVEGAVPDYESPDARNAVVISAPMARRLGRGVGDRIDAFFISDSDGTIRMRRMEIVGIYETYFAEYDRMIGYASAGLLQRVSGLDADSGTTVVIEGLDGLDEGGVQRLTDTLGHTLADGYYDGAVDGYYVAQSVYQRNPMYFGWLELLDTNVLVILILMACVSGFTLVSCLFILILERVRMIGILKAMGAGNRLIRNVFVLLSGRVVIPGLVIGDVIALILIWIQSRWHLMTLDPEAYCISYVPVHLTVPAFVILNLAVVVFSLLLLLIPTRLIAGVSPASTMRYE